MKIFKIDISIKRITFQLFLLLLLQNNLSALSPTKKINRRQALQGLTLTIPAWTIPNIVNAQPISERIIAESLTKIEPTTTNNELKQKGIDNLYYPPWLEGTWDATQTLTKTSTPLGLKYIGGPNGSLSIAKETMAEQEKELNKVYNLKLKFIETKFGVAEDRLFNNKQRLNAFAGRNVVAGVDYADVGVCNRASFLTLGGTENDPLQTTVVRFKGPAAQKTFLLGHDSYMEENKFVAYESLRSIFALTNTNTAPPVTTDTELIWSYEKLDSDTIKAKLRIASYLNSQSDSLYFEARNRAVSFNDYDITLKKVA